MARLINIEMVTKAVRHAGGISKWGPVLLSKTVPSLMNRVCTGAKMVLGMEVAARTGSILSISLFLQLGSQSIASTVTLSHSPWQLCQGIGDLKMWRIKPKGRGTGNPEFPWSYVLVQVSSCSCLGSPWTGAFHFLTADTITWAILVNGLSVGNLCL